MIFAHFNPRSPYGERQKWDTMSGSDQLFQSTLPLRGATPEDYFDTIIVDISIHAPLTGSDLFYDTAAYPPLYFNPRSPYGERHFRYALVESDTMISIHAPLTGSDFTTSPMPLAFTISIHAPLTGSDSICLRGGLFIALFQSTLPLRGATFYFPPRFVFYSDFNPRSPYGERRQTPLGQRPPEDFNPRSPYGERHCGYCRCC